MQDNKEKQNIQQNKTENSETLLFKIGRLAGKVYFGIKRLKKTTPKREKKDRIKLPDNENNEKKQKRIVKNDGQRSGNTLISKPAVKKIVKKSEKSEAEISRFTEMINSKKATKVLTICFALMFVLFSVSMLWVYRPFSINRGIPSKVTMYYSFNGKKEVKDVDGNKVFRDNGEIYLNLTDVYSNFGMSVIGDLNKMKYTLPNGEYMILTNQSDEMEMNGETVRLTGCIYIEGQNVYVPTSLFCYYTVGSNIVYNTELERLTISRVVNEDKSNSIQTIYVDFDFLLSKPVPSSPVTQPEF